MKILSGSLALFFLGSLGSLCAQSIEDYFVEIRSVPGGENIQVDMMYAGSQNFTGQNVTGYLGNYCYLLPRVAQALGRLQKELNKQNLSLIMKDCYRPWKSVQFFKLWRDSPGGLSMREHFFPLYKSKEALFSNRYIGSYSAHTQGHVVDLTLGSRNDAGQIEEWDMGTPVDFLDPASQTHAEGQVGSRFISEEQVQHRRALVKFMKAAGFKNYFREWWHWEFSLYMQRRDLRAQNFDVTAPLPLQKASVAQEPTTPATLPPSSPPASRSQPESSSNASLLNPFFGPSGESGGSIPQ